MLNSKKIQEDEPDIPIQDEIDGENQHNLNKYDVAGNIAREALTYLKNNLVVGTPLVDLCKLTDSFILKKLDDVYRDKVFEKGICFPTCISMNNVAGYFSPLNDDTTKIENNSLIKVELGVHIDGFPVIVGDTVMIGEPNEKQKKILNCLEELRDIKSCVKIGKNSNDFYEFLTNVTKKHGCELLDCDEMVQRCAGIYSYQIAQDVVDGRNDKDMDYEQHKTIFGGKNRHEYDIENFDFEHNQIFVLDVAVSSGKGFVGLKDTKETTVYKYDMDAYYSLKLQASKNTINIMKKRGCFPTNIRDVDDVKFRLGLKECITEGLIEPYHVLYEKDGEYIASFKQTVILRKGNKKKKNRNIVY